MSLLNLSPELAVEEMLSAKKILDKWSPVFENQLPGIHIPGSEEQLEATLREFCGEMRVVASKTATLAEVLLGD